MVNQKIKDIDKKKLKHAKGAVYLLELLGVDEEDLLLLKDIPELKKELDALKKEFQEFKGEVLRTISVKNSNNDKKPLSESFKEAYGQPIKEFNPHYGR